jgi:hypothetical protein
MYLAIQRERERETIVLKRRRVKEVRADGESEESGTPPGLQH